MTKKWFSFVLFQKFPLVAALIAQVLSFVLIKGSLEIFNFHLKIIEFVFFQTTFSVVMTQLIFRLPKWFFYISVLFPLLFVLGFYYFSFSKGIYGFLFCFCAVTFSHTLKERVPLYLSNRTTHEALKTFLDQNKTKTFVDLGSGLGGVVRSMNHSKVTSVGIETAPLLWILSSLMSRFTLKGKILRQNIWATSLDKYDVVYAFLSPAIMDKLYQKVKSEMKAGSFFISNSFEVKGVEADEIWQLNDGRETKLYFYKIYSSSSQSNSS